MRKTIKTELTLEQVQGMGKIADNLLEVPNKAFALEVVAFKEEIAVLTEEIYAKNSTIFEEIESDLTPKLQAYEKEREEIIAKLALRDDNGNFILDDIQGANGKQQIYTFPADEESKKLKEGLMYELELKYKDDLAKFYDLQNKIKVEAHEVEVSLFTLGVNFADLPECVSVKNLMDLSQLSFERMHAYTEQLKAVKEQKETPTVVPFEAKKAGKVD